MTRRKTFIVTDKPERAQASNHLADLLAATQERPLKPGVYAVLVEHEDWCTLLKNRGPCNCLPDIKLSEWTEK